MLKRVACSNPAAAAAAPHWLVCALVPIATFNLHVWDRCHCFVRQSGGSVRRVSTCHRVFCARVAPLPLLCASVWGVYPLATALSMQVWAIPDQGTLAKDGTGACGKGGAAPRLLCCLAHHGLVTWDLQVHEYVYKQRICVCVCVCVCVRARARDLCVYLRVHSFILSVLVGGRTSVHKC